MGLLEAYERGGETVILTDADDNVVEGPGFNVFAVNDGAISTPDRGVLEGITRRTVIELADEHDIPARSQPRPGRRLRRADEVFLSSTAGGIIPVTTVDGRVYRRRKARSRDPAVARRVLGAARRPALLSPVTL